MKYIALVFLIVFAVWSEARVPEIDIISRVIKSVIVGVISGGIWEIAKVILKSKLGFLGFLCLLILVSITLAFVNYGKLSENISPILTLYFGFLISEIWSDVSNWVNSSEENTSNQ